MNGNAREALAFFDTFINDYKKQNKKTKQRNKTGSEMKTSRREEKSQRGRVWIAQIRMRRREKGEM